MIKAIALRTEYLMLDWPEEIREENFTAIAVYSDMDTSFSFESSDKGLDQIVKNTFWSVTAGQMICPAVLISENIFQHLKTTFSI